ncbi:MAG: PEP/pyruvate-binding domain-containing protein [Candidatus Kryptoniota bacterium]
MIFKKLLKRHTRETVSSREKLFQFQRLLFANDEALKLMGSLSDIISSGKPFSKREIYPIYADILKRTEEVAEQLILLSGGKFKSLLNRVQSIKESCDKFLAPIPLCPEGWECSEPDCTHCKKERKTTHPVPYSYKITEITIEKTREVGAKMSRLCEVHNKLGIPIPDGFCLTSRCFEEFLETGGLYRKIDDALGSIDFNNIDQVQQVSRVIQALIVSSPIPEPVEQTILREYDDLSKKYGGNVFVSVRSSAIGEDDLEHSFAGLHYTALNVSRVNLIDACIEVLISKYLPQSLVYRFITGLRDVDMPMSIGCLKMIDAETSGVLFTRDPLGIKNGIIIHAVRGLGTKVVDGSVDPQEFIVNPAGNHEVLSFKPGSQDYMAIPRQTDGLADEKIPQEAASVPCLNDNQIKLLSDYALKIEEHFGTPQDIEWGVDKNGNVYILQCRPLAISTDEKVDKKSPPPENNPEPENPVLIESGNCASPGVASGKVFLLQKMKDIVDFPSGGVLVVKKTSPELTRVLHKASAVVSDIGNTTGHLAIIARELGIPVLVNTGNATGRLVNGSFVTVDASEHRVYLGLLTKSDRQGIQRNRFHNSPMYRIWKSISQLIIPLNLTDPDSANFSPENCETLHDVTRFAHEYAMREMFSIYESAGTKGERAYPLKFPVPLNVHVIDLGGGLKVTDIKKEITPDDIQSKPLISLIKGMTAPGVRWAGPLPIDLKGFTGLIISNIVDPGRAEGTLGGRSYAIVSDCYLNFSSRLGYHFSRLDAYASEEINNNYINFDFRGGAADPVRRVRRARVVARILERMNFSVTLQTDNVLATIRKIPMQSILDLLTEIGRLMGAVRNADVTFVNDENVEEFVEAFLNGDSAPAMRFARET